MGERKVMKRYLVFGCEAYSSSGGASDVIGETDTVDEIREMLRSKEHSWHDWYDVLDLEERRWLSEDEFSARKEK